jgi:hypothetical protein
MKTETKGDWRLSEIQMIILNDMRQYLEAVGEGDLPFEPKAITNIANHLKVMLDSGLDYYSKDNKKP